MISDNLRESYRKFLPDVTDEEIRLAELMADMIMPMTYHPDFLNMKLSDATSGHEFTWEINTDKNQTK